MAMELPKEFRNIPLALLWEYVKLGDELRGLADDQHQENYWDGWHDCMAALFGDLTHKPVVYLQPGLQAQFEDFRMEDKLTAMERQMKDENG